MNRDANELPTIIAELEDGLRAIESIQCVDAAGVLTAVLTFW